MMLVVRVITNYEGADPATIAKSSDRGDVIEVLPDTQQWGRLDLTSPDWIIFRIAITPAEAEAMRAPQLPETQTSRKRAFHLNLDLLRSLGISGIPTVAEAELVRNRYRAQGRDRGIGESAAKHLPENARPIAIVDVGAADFLAAKTLKPIVVDPFIIG